MNLSVIACNVFQREVCACIAQSHHLADVEFVELGQHVHSATLRQILQSRIDAADRGPRPYDAVVLAYGICGNSTVGLVARKTRLVIPRAHDCCAILLGSKDRFKEHFAEHPSTPFSSSGYFDRGEYYLRVDDGAGAALYSGDAYRAYVEQYGEENAAYIWETLHPKREGNGNRAVFIEIPEMAHLGHAARFKAKVEADGKQYVCLQGSLDLLRRILSGEWRSEEVLVVEPGEKIAGVYDWSEIIRAVPASA